MFLLSRLQRLWEEEVSRHGSEKASVPRVMLRFQRTRIILDVLLGCCFGILSMLGPVSGGLNTAWKDSRLERLEVIVGHIQAHARS